MTSTSSEYEQNILIKRSGGKILQNMETKKKQPKRRPFPINRGWTGPSPLGVKMGVPELPIPDGMQIIMIMNLIGNWQIPLEKRLFLVKRINIEIE